MLNRDCVEEWAKKYDKENEDEKLREDKIFEYIEEIWFATIISCETDLVRDC